MAHDAVGNRAEARLFKFVCRPAIELGGNLVPPGGLAGAALDDFHRVQAEGEQNRFLQPLVDMPVAVRLFFCDTDFTAVEQNERLFDGFAHFAARGRVDTVALVKSLFDCLLKGRRGLAWS